MQSSMSFRRTLALLLTLVVTLGGCTAGSVRPESETEASSTAGPPRDDDFIAMAMDETTDPEPPGGRPDVTAIGDTVLFLESTAYDVVYSETKRNPLVVAYFLRQHTDQDFDPCNRPSRFLKDDRTAAKVVHDDFTGSGYDRGHMAPNQSIATRHGCEAQRETFLLSNIAPQLPDLNQRTWAAYEIVVDSVYADDFEGIWVLTGPIFDPEQIVTMCDTEIEVPVEFWKVVIRRKPNDDLDAAAIVMKKDERRDRPIGEFSTTIDDIEKRTGIDFFPDLPLAEEQAIESACPGDDWKLNQRLPPPHPGAPRDICEEPPQARSPALQTEVGHSPVCAL